MAPRGGLVATRKQSAYDEAVRLLNKWDNGYRTSRGLAGCEADAKTRPPNYLIDELRSRLARGPVEYRLIARPPNRGDATNDPSLVWPDDRKAVDLGTISIVSVDPDSATEKALAYDPTNLTDGIELSDDRLPALRAKVYAMSVARRHGR